MRAYVVHGYTANPSKHWFPWLQIELNNRGVECHCLAMPNSEQPTPEIWLEHLIKNVEIDEQTILIGHSLGCISLLTLLQATQKQPKAAFFVSGFYQKLPNLPELDCFADFYQNHTPCKKVAFPSVVLASLDDSVVAHQFSDNLAQHLGCSYYRLPTGGHFLDREGVTELPELLRLLEPYLAT